MLSTTRAPNLQLRSAPRSPETFKKKKENQNKAKMTCVCTTVPTHLTTYPFSTTTTTTSAVLYPSRLGPKKKPPPARETTRTTAPVSWPTGTTKSAQWSNQTGFSSFLKHWERKNRGEKKKVMSRCGVVWGWWMGTTDCRVLRRGFVRCGQGWWWYWTWHLKFIWREDWGVEYNARSLLECSLFSFNLDSQSNTTSLFPCFGFTIKYNFSFSFYLVFNQIQTLHFLTPFFLSLSHHHSFAPCTLCSPSSSSSSPTLPVAPQSATPPKSPLASPTTSPHRATRRTG